MARILKVLSIALFVAALGAPTAPAAAHGFHHGGGGFHSHFFFGFGCCGGFGPYYPAYDPYYGYAYYPDPYAYPPPVPVPTPGTVYQYQAPAYQAPASNCRQFNGNATVDASGQPFHGTACLESDGRWHITNP